jgi:hypothetical protein
MFKRRVSLPLSFLQCASSNPPRFLSHQPCPLDLDVLCSLRKVVRTLLLFATLGLALEVGTLWAGEPADSKLSPEGRRALAIAPESWNRDETKHFVLHFTQSFIGTPVGVEAEFYYRVITAELGIAPASNLEKSHIYIFEKAAAWAEFVRSIRLEEWTGAASIGNDLFLPRYPEYKFKGSTLGHEVAHLLVGRHLGGNLPLWLSEGYAEDVAKRSHAAFQRARGYRAKPRSPAPESVIPLSQLTAYTAYPPSALVSDFYRQSRQLAGFIRASGTNEQFVKFFRLMADGEPLERALSAAYGARWSSAEALERDFLKGRSATKSGEDADAD